MAFQAIVYELFHPLLGAAARNRWLIHWLFDVRIPRQTVVHFDPTTLLLRHALRQSVAPDDRTALEVGIGQGGLLALGLLKSTALQVHGVDYSAARVHSSQQVADFNQLKPRFYVSDLLDGIPSEQQFDLIFFNPPYVPTVAGKQLKLTHRMRADSDRVWDGGDDGVQVLQAFLEQAHRFLAPHGRILFGLQPLFLPTARVERIVAETRWKIKRQVRRCCIPSIVYILVHADGEP